MTVLTPNQIGLLIYMVGGWGPGPYTHDAKGRQAVVKFLDIAIAVAHGESTWDTAAINRVTTEETSGPVTRRMVGLYQINESVHASKIAASIARYTAEDNTPNGPREGKVPTLLDPRVNIDVARQVYQESGNTWRPWQAFTDKSAGYKSGLGHGEEVFRYLNSEKQIQKAYKKLLAEIDLGHVTIDTANILNPVGIATKLSEWSVSDWTGWIKSAGVTIGVFVIALIALILGVWFIITNTKTGKAVVSAVPQGKILKAVS